MKKIKEITPQKNSERFSRLQELVKNTSGPEVLELLNPVLKQIDDDEKRMRELETHDFIIYNPRNRNISKQTETFKQWQKINQVYQNNIKIVLKAIAKNSVEEEDSLDEFLDAWKTRQ